MVMQNPILNRFMKITQGFDREKERQKKSAKRPTGHRDWIRNIFEKFTVDLQLKSDISNKAGQ